MFSVNQTEKQLMKALVKSVPDAEQHADDLKMTGIGRTLKTHIGAIVVMLKQLDWDAQFHGNVSHEIFHAATFILEDAGVRFEPMVSDEAYAYLIGWLTQEFYRNLKTNK
jgi:hypothetical protein